VAQALERIEEVGGTTVVFGSGGARRVPDDYPEDEARTQLVYFGNMLADYAGDLTIAVEPLEPAGCNILNTIAETAQYVREVGRPGVRLLADSYHMDAQQDPWESIAESGDILAHVHCCDRKRLPPGQGEADLPGFFEALCKGGYEGRISVECNLPDFESDARKALETIKDLATRKR
jgi:sugar phosphate isomerase/epimerase